ncbi:unnamed protein product [Darwinula stevensoni]|uniref:Transmembrane protein 115 n=1 Tax=Darwinula stevensoni TaxID=69355 RepID=A0A7R9FQP4_9CRUS|nr:unnamed protein product [Darwinula stevensoni]CAG0900166.1 unnamed protein product [Darwinula stevensoni]
MASSMNAMRRNFAFIFPEVKALWKNTTLFVRSICLIIFSCYFLSYSETAVEVISVTPGYLWPPHLWVWTACTHFFLELHFWEVCVDIATLVLCGKLIEPLWGAFEMVVFFFLVNILVGFLAGVFYLILYSCTFQPGLLFSLHIHGLSGYIAGVTVAVKQIMPDHVLIRTPVTKITNRNVPLCIFTLTVILHVIGLLEGTYPSMFLCGIVISWTYLRFYQKHRNGSKGDMAENFSFASFFPNVIQPPISVVSNFIHSLMVRIGLCEKIVRKYDFGAPSSITISLPGMEAQDAERRR